MQLLSTAQQTSLAVALVLVLLVLGVIFFRRFLRRGLGEAARGQVRGADELPAPWRALRDEAERSNWVLSETVFEQAQRLFIDFYANGSSTAADASPSLSTLTREWAHEEFLLVVAEDGLTPAPVKNMIESFSKTAAAHPAFHGWFREAVLDEGDRAGAPVLLAARWLCHLTGLRHPTVEIFIDPPHLAGHTLVQVRGMDKFEAPGAFDIPCAGHVSGVDSMETALEKELMEELNLKVSQLDDLRLLGRYNACAADDACPGARERRRRTINNEHRVLYRARLRPEAAAAIRFSDGEVAGLAVFAVSELRALVQRYPERIAGGLSGAMDFYD